jgi:hypothetical protein
LVRAKRKRNYELSTFLPPFIVVSSGLVNSDFPVFSAAAS